MKPLKNQKENIAERLGETFAVIQHATDLVAEWGLKKMRDVETKQPASAKGQSRTGKLSYWGRNAVSFMGAVGDAYYKKYEESKRKRKST